MNKVRVEVFYQDNALQSIRIDKCEMEGLTAIENSLFQNGLCLFRAVPAGRVLAKK